MSTRGGGRGVGRGVGRGRSRGAGPTDTRRPGDVTQATPTTQTQQQVGRGRGRASAQAQQKPPPVQVAPPTVDETAQKVAKMTVTEPQPSTKPPQRSQRRAGPEADDQMSTKPQHVDDKRGTSGNPVNLMTNHIALSSRTGHAIYQYYVDFNPPVDGRSLRRFLLKVHRESLLGNVFSFDGMVLYLPHKLPDTVTELVSQSKDGDNYRVTIKLTNELSANSPVCLQLFNVLFRSVLKMLGLKQIGRHYYNQALSSTIPQHKLELLPGFVTSILQYEKSVMLCADISHKILRMDTVLDLFYDISQNARDVHEACTRSIVGEIVLTRYNNRTYRVDDIDWNKNPATTFTMADGSEISFKEYYKKVIQGRKWLLAVENGG